MLFVTKTTFSSLSDGEVIAICFSAAALAFIALLVCIYCTKKDKQGRQEQPRSKEQEVQLEVMTTMSH